jgi:hypothetical protein
MATTKMSEATIDLIKQSYLAGMTYSAIGAVAHCGMGTIANVVKAAGLPPRGKAAKPKPVSKEQLETLAEGGFKAKTVEPDLSYLDHTTTVAAPKAKAPKAKAKKSNARKPAKPARKTPRAVKGKRLPPVGTAIKKLDRDGKVRARCTVVKDGIKYAGKTYNSISSAAMAAMKALGLKSTAVNGYVWWGVGK